MKNKYVFWVAVICGAICSSTVYAKENIGFLTAETAPDSLSLLPPPPPESSVAFLQDKAMYEKGHVLKNDKRFELAAKDANYKNFGQAFSDAFGIEISAEHTPALYRLLTAVLQDSHDYAMRSAKNHYMRVRPFVVYNNPTCTPEQDSKMGETGSYPSGHASFGWAAALVLAEINPAREMDILKRGIDFGESRVICGAHWQSDVDNGRIMGAAVVAALHANTRFETMLYEAKKEFATLSAKSK
ncbi:acid phosphatase [Enterobacter cancerogenus]|uniref:acid phosphatase n=1 Tax=Enterobacter cancerogenus TaxID=69218 RepID=UPI00235E5C4B|nr:phosphatase PAP2 family protein [Enterobacter cancerogenus]